MKLSRIFQAAALAAVCFAPQRARATEFVLVSREEAAQGSAVCITGVVTCVAGWQKASCIIASPDDPDGIAFYVTGEHPDALSTPLPEGGLSVGDIIEVRGRWAPLFFAPGISASGFARLGTMRLPPAPRRDLCEFAGGRLDNRRAAFAGVLQSAITVSPNETELVLATPSDNIACRAGKANAGPVDWEGLVDSEVVLSGIAMSSYNQRAEFLGIRLEIAGDDGLAVTRRASADPFGCPEVPLDAILAWHPGDRNLHRVKVRGHLTAAFKDGTFYLQSGDKAIRGNGERGKWNGAPGTGYVEAVGFVEMIDGVGQLTGAVLRGCGQGQGGAECGAASVVPIELPPAAITSLSYRADITYIDYDCRLVSLKGRLYSGEASSDRGCSLFMDVAGKGVEVSVPDALPEWVEAELGFKPLVRVTGIARFVFSHGAAQGRRPSPNSVRIEARGPGDVEFVPDDVWRKRRDAAFANRALTMLAAILAVFAVVFPITVRRRSLARRRSAAILAKERRRMTDDLHDTIEQHLAGAKILISTAVGTLPETGAERCARALAMAADVLAGAKAGIRDVIMNLRSDRLMSMSLSDILSGIAARTNRTGAVRVETRLEDVPDDLSPGARADIAAIVQQAIANATGHGRATRVAISCAGGALRVLNDGEKFDPAAAPGPESGHFGISNMRERALRNGLRLAWETEGEWIGIRLETAASGSR